MKDVFVFFRAIDFDIDDSDSSLYTISGHNDDGHNLNFYIEGNTINAGATIDKENFEILSSHNIASILDLIPLMIGNNYIIKFFPNIIKWIHVSDPRRIQQDVSNLNDRTINFPDFKKMSDIGMAKFLLANDKGIKHSKFTTAEPIAAERSNIELELWCKEVYLKNLDQISLMVTDNPSTTILLSSDVD